MGAWIIVAILVVGLIVVAIGRTMLPRGSASAGLLSVLLAMAVLAIALAAMFAFVRVSLILGSGPLELPPTATPFTPFATPGDGNNVIAP